jgi:hypothetical protein
VAPSRGRSGEERLRGGGGGLLVPVGVHGKRLLEEG